VAVGWSTLYNNTGNNNTAVGANVAGTYNSALYANTTGTENAAFGTSALVSNTTGSNNVAVGSRALVANTTASSNTAIGYEAGLALTTGGNNVLMGHYSGIGGAGAALTTATANTFIGPSAGYLVTTGSKNTFVGAYSGNSGSLDLRTTSNHIVLSDGDGNPRGYFDSSGTFIITRTAASGLASIGVYTETTGSAANVFVGSDGYFKRSTSSLKYKKNVVDTTHGLTDLLKLRSVTYQGKAEADAGKTFGGLIAEEVHDAGLTEFVQYADDGSPDALAYGNMVSLCIKAIQELKAEVDSLKSQLNQGA